MLDRSGEMTASQACAAGSVVLWLQSMLLLFNSHLIDVLDLDSVSKII